MGLQLQSGQEIAGFPALKVRDLLRAVGHENFCPEWLIVKGFSHEDASRLVSALLESGLIEPDLDQIAYEGAGPWYKLTDQGKAVAHARFAKPVKRETATRALSEFMDRVRIVNESTRFLVRVNEVVVFGSYLSDKEELGDLDIALNCENKFRHLDRAAFHKKIGDHCKAGRHFEGVAYLFWPEAEVYLFLKNKKRTISLHPMNDPEEMIRQSNDFHFEVLLGDRETIINRCKSH